MPDQEPDAPEGERRRRVVPAAPPAADLAADDRDADDDGEDVTALRLPHHDWRIYLLAIPVAVGLAWLWDRWGLLRLAAWIFVRMPMHEFGHAAAGWLTGFPSVPLLFFTHTVGRSVFGVLCGVGMLSAGLVAVGIHQRRHFLTGLGAALGIGVVAGCGLLSERSAEMVFVYGGCAGEIAFGALLSVAFFYRMPPAVRWDMLRFPALLLGVYALREAWVFWGGVADGSEAIPYGSELGGQKDRGGDMNRLREKFKWSEGDIVAAYLWPTRLAVWTVAGHWAYFLARSVWKELTRPPPPPPPPKVSFRDAGDWGDLPNLPG